MQRLPLYLVLAAVPLVLIVLYANSRKPAEEVAALPPGESAVSAEGPGLRMAPGNALIGGIERPKSDVQLPSGRPAKRELPKRRQGYSPAISPDANEQVRMVADALVERTQPERFSSFVVPHNFDEKQFKQDPRQYADEYAKIIEPGRVFAPAQPGEGVTVLHSVLTRYHRVRQGESVRLGVKAVPNAPVTFTSFKLGQFENQLTTITVVADDEGMASAVYTASGGTIDEARILAASPITSGQVTFTVTVLLDD